MGDKIKFALALLLLAVGIAGFYLLSERAMILRVLSVLGGIGASVIVAWQTALGRRFFDFAKESVNESYLRAVGVGDSPWPPFRGILNLGGVPDRVHGLGHSTCGVTG